MDGIRPRCFITSTNAMFQTKNAEGIVAGAFDCAGAQCFQIVLSQQARPRERYISRLQI